MIFFPHAKINIGLNIVKKRENGYHEIKSLFFPVPLKDVLEIRPSEEGEITNFIQTGIELPLQYKEDNLVMRAYYLLFKDFPSLPSLNIHLHKIIPHQAGLGGGSSDAVFTIMLINRICKLNLSSSQLYNYAKKLGSDCPFFLQNKPKSISGTGDIIKDVDINLSGYWLTLLKIPDGVSTQEAYQNITPHISRVPYEKLMPISHWKYKLRNDFEPYVFEKYPILASFKKYLYEIGAIFVSLTGTGSCIYALSENKLIVEKANTNTMFLWQGIL